MIFFACMKRIMYVENKGGGENGLDGAGRICWVEMSRSRGGYYFDGKLLHKTRGYKYNCVDKETGEHYWVSGPKKNGEDKLYGGVVEIDEDAREEYWLKIRNRPESVHLKSYRS